jgi:hypothetical protein
MSPCCGRACGALRSQSGQALILFALALPVFLAFCAVLIDGSNLMVQRRVVQNAADAAVLAVAQSMNTTCDSACLANAPLYSKLNGVDVDTTSPSWHSCAAGDPADTNCYAFPYVDENGVSHDQQVEVRLSKPVTGFFTNALGLHVSARAVAGVGHGAPPPYSFVALNDGSENHTLIVRSGGDLTVKGSVYVNSSNAHDGFDIKGTGGSITAQTIDTVGGWEFEDAATMTLTVGGSVCHPPARQVTAPWTAPGCPVTGATPLADPFAGRIPLPELAGPACTSPAYGAAASYSPKQNLVGALANLAAATTVLSNGTAVQNGDMIQINTEKMLVTGVSGTTLTVERAQAGSNVAAHNSGAEIKELPITGTTGTALSPAACGVPSGAVTMQPGTYYGGVCIGATSGTRCDNNCDTGTARVTLTPGTYIMAGGGFHVCGSSTLSAPNVMIFNTNDPSYTTAAPGATDQIELNTSGSVTLGPQTAGPYAGLTIFEPATRAVSDSNCDKRAQDDWDVALVKTANGIDGLSGTIYAPHEHALFGDAVSGTANLAVITGCIFINGADSTFDFEGSGLFGIGTSLDE